METPAFDWKPAVSHFLITAFAVWLVITLMKK
jgi:hypothetical protein